MKSRGSSVVENVAGEPGEDEQAVEVIVKPVFPFFVSLKEEALYVLACLVKKRGFRPEFLRYTFGPFLFNKMSRTNGDIHAAVNLWCSDRAAAEEKYGHISHWDVSRVTNMKELFQSKRDFNEDISAWDTSNVIDMGGMFNSAEAFNQPIGRWDVSKVQNMEGMFAFATAFNQPIGGWDVSNVTDMGDMFHFASAFNEPIGGWDVSNVESMRGMFNEARAFNQPIGGWDVSKVRSMEYIFCGATPFNQQIGNWDTSKVENTERMFNLAGEGDEDDDESDSQDPKTCDYCSKQVHRDMLEYMEEASMDGTMTEGSGCRDCLMFCERCMQSRKRSTVTWFEAKVDNAFSACDVCWTSADNARPSHGKGEHVCTIS